MKTFKNFYCMYLIILILSFVLGMHVVQADSPFNCTLEYEIMNETDYYGYTYDNVARKITLNIYADLKDNKITVFMTRFRNDYISEGYEVEKLGARDITDLNNVYVYNFSSANKGFNISSEMPSGKSLEFRLKKYVCPSSSGGSQEGSSISYEVVPSKTEDLIPDKNAPIESPYSDPFEFCQCHTMKIFKIIGYVITIIKILIPLILIIYGTIEFGQAVLSKDEKAISEAGVMLSKRASAGIIIFFIPTVISFIMSLVGNISELNTTDFYKCSSCITDTASCDVSACS